MSRPLDDLRLAVLMLDGIELKGRCCVVALGIDTDGVKHPARAVGRLDRERDRRDHAAGQPRRARPGCRAGRAGRASTAPRRCARPSATCSASTRRCSAASATRSETCSTTCPSATARPSSAGCARRWALDDHAAALERLHALAGELERSHPGAAASLREGLEETLTVTRLGVRGALQAHAAVARTRASR